MLNRKFLFGLCAVFFCIFPSFIWAAMCPDQKNIHTATINKITYWVAADGWQSVYPASDDKAPVAKFSGAVAQGAKKNEIYLSACNYSTEGEENLSLIPSKQIKVNVSNKHWNNVGPGYTFMCQSNNNLADCQF